MESSHPEKTWWKFMLVPTAVYFFPLLFFHSSVWCPILLRKISFITITVARKHKNKMENSSYSPPPIVMFKWTSLDACSQSTYPNSNVSKQLCFPKCKHGLLSIFCHPFSYLLLGAASLGLPGLQPHALSVINAAINALIRTARTAGLPASLLLPSLMCPAVPHLQTVYLKTAMWCLDVSCADACSDDFQIYTKFQMIGSNSAFQKYPKFNNRFPYTPIYPPVSLRHHLSPYWWHHRKNSILENLAFTPILDHSTNPHSFIFYTSWICHYSVFLWLYFCLSSLQLVWNFDSSLLHGLPVSKLYFIQLTHSPKENNLTVPESCPAPARFKPPQVSLSPDETLHFLSSHAEPWGHWLLATAPASPFVTLIYAPPSRNC